MRSVTLSLVRSFGLAGGTARALGAISAAVAKLADHGDPKCEPASVVLLFTVCLPVPCLAAAGIARALNRLLHG